MPRIANWEAVAPKADRGKAPMPEPGCYTACVTEMESLPEKEYVWMVYELVDPEPEFFKRNAVPKAKHRICLSYKNEQALAMTRGRMKALSESNTGFDADAAFLGDNWQAFWGKRFGVRMREEESVFTNDKGETVKFVRTGPTEVFPISEMDQWKAKGISRKPLSKKDKERWDAEVRKNPAACRDTTATPTDGQGGTVQSPMPGSPAAQVTSDFAVPF